MEEEKTPPPNMGASDMGAARNGASNLVFWVCRHCFSQSGTVVGRIKKGEKPQFLGIRYILLKWLNVIMFLFNPHISVPFHSKLISAYKLKYDTIKFVAKLDHGKNG